MEDKDDEGFLNELVDVAKTYWDSLGDLEMQKSIALGGILGSVMAGVSTVREMKAEDRFLGNFHKLVKDNEVNRYLSHRDLIQKNPDETLATDESGKYIEDPSKSKEFLKERLGDYIRNKRLIQFAKDGNIEAFEALKNKKDFDTFLPFLQVEGGLQAALYYIDNLAEKDVQYMQNEGVPIDLATTKRELREKVVAFQKL